MFTFVSWLRSLSDAPAGPVPAARKPTVAAARKGRARPSRVPIRALGPRCRDRIRRHLLALEAGDRYMRFGYAASDEQIERYVAQLDFDRDEIFGIYNRRLELIAVAHLAYAPAMPSSAGARGAEFGVSVLKLARGRGYGAKLFARAVIQARNAGVQQLMIQTLSENTAMLRIARRAGATVQREGSESEAYLQLPPPGIGSRITQLLQAQAAEVDYRIKQRTRQIQRLLRGPQAA
jgi:RimJ/RimL family protein N-acetyltransferase